MRLIDFPERTKLIAEHQPEYLTMPAHISPEGVITCLWALTWRERLRVLIQGRLWHQIMTFHKPVQPQLISVHRPRQLANA